jgi:hypothetical protein
MPDEIPFWCSDCHRLVLRPPCPGCVLALSRDPFLFWFLAAAVLAVGALLALFVAKTEERSGGRLREVRYERQIRP